MRSQTGVNREKNNYNWKMERLKQEEKTINYVQEREFLLIDS